MLLLALLTPGFAGVLINEVAYQVASTDTGYEWVELCNSGSSPVDLSGYALQSAGSSFSTIYTLSTSYTLNPGDYVIIGGPYATIYTGAFSSDLENGGTYVDGVRLLDASGTTVDTVLYNGTSNKYQLSDDSGIFDPPHAAPNASDGKSIGRTGCVDTNDSSVDFVVFDTPTPGTENVVAPPDTGTTDTGTTDTGTVSSVDCSAASVVKINEFLPDPDGDDSGAEWVEFYNASDTDAVMDGWEFQWDTSDLNSPSKFTMPAGSIIPARGYLTIGALGTSVNLGMGNASSSGDGIRLVCNGTPVDTVIYGPNNDDGFPDDNGTTATSLAPKPASGVAIVRKTEGVDTNLSGDDFMSCDQPSPGATNNCIARPCTSVPGSMLINEFTPESDHEWVEFYNASGADLDVSGWAFQFGGSTIGKPVAFPIGTVVPAGGYYVIGTPVDGVQYLDLAQDIDLGNATSNGDILQLVCGDEATVIDTVVYAKAGKTNTDSWLDDNGQVATSLAPTPESGGSSQRIPNGVDTQNSGDDFQATLNPTPGAENSGGTVDPGECSAGGTIKVNEVMYDPTADDASNEWVELYNAGSEPVDLYGYTLETAKSSWTVAYRVPESAVLQPGEFYLIGAEAIVAANAIAEDLDLGNGTDGDGVRIVDCEGTTLDTVLYGDPLADEIEGDEGSLEVVATATSGSSIGRYPDGLDNNAASDWKFYAVPSPGAPNADATYHPPDCPESGCARSKDPRCATTGSCATVLPFGGWEAALAVLVLLRRRKDV